MSSGLEAIANELRRLQRDGVNRVFIEDHTLSLLVPQKENKSNSMATGPRTATEPADHTDLQDLIKQPAQAQPATPSKSTQSAAPQPALPAPPKIELPDGDAKTQLAWLREQVYACPVCKDHLGEDEKIVFGAGSPDANIVFCGEAPGTDEARTGEPFVGKAGQLLTKIITAMGLSREQVYLTNLLKWRPEHDKPYGNRPPNLEEMNFCLPYLQAQIQIIQPKVIIALGNTTVTGLLGPAPDRKFGQVRGTWASFDEIPVMITFHPTYLLRNGTLKTKRQAWEDMLQVMEKCNLAISEKQRGFFLPKT